MNIIVFGINHQTAPISIREKFYLTPLEQDLFLSELKNIPEVIEAFVLSTCNRTEIYLNSLDNWPASHRLIELMCSIKKIENSTVHEGHFYSLTQSKAIEHLFFVSCGLDSLVLGEKQILGQVKASIERAMQKKMFSRTFNILFNLAVRTAKKAQTETAICAGGSSVSWAAMVMAENLLGSLKESSILIIGAGKMGELALNQIQQRGVKNIYMMNRTGSAAEALAQKCGGIASSFEDIKDVLMEVDVCFCAASAPHYILDRRSIERIMPLRAHRKLIFIDISMPRNIDPSVSTVPFVDLVCIDDLKKVMDETKLKRQEAVYEVESIIADKIKAFYEKIEKRPEPSFLEESVSDLIF